MYIQGCHKGFFFQIVECIAGDFQKIRTLPRKVPARDDGENNYTMLWFLLEAQLFLTTLMLVSRMAKGF